MKAVVFKEFGGPSVVHVSEVDVPEVGAGQVLIDVRAASVNPVDVKRIGGLFGPIDFPAVTGADASGVVTALGADVSDLEVGDAVFGIGSGTHAEQAVLTAAARKPDQLSWIEAAAAGVGGETAFRVLTLLGVESGSTVLIDGASGGVGTFAVQMAVARGATVIATASEANHEYLQSLGAIAISYGDGLASRVAERRARWCRRSLRRGGQDRPDGAGRHRPERRSGGQHRQFRGRRLRHPGHRGR